MHSAFKLHDENGTFLRGQLEGLQGTRHFRDLAIVDIVIIDEVSMLQADALRGIDQALNYVLTRGTTQRGLMAFGRKSMLVVGDLHQLPSIEKYGFTSQQIYDSTLWSEFKFLELTQVVRTDAAEARFAELLLRARRGWQHLNDEDWQLLESRVCANHCAACESFTDVMRVRPPGGTRRDEVAVPQVVRHCPIACTAAGGHASATCVLAARRAKVDELNARYGRRAAPVGAQPCAVQAVDTDVDSGRPVRSAQVRERISSKLAGLAMEAEYYVGQLVVITVNRRRQHAGYVNSALAEIVELAPALPHAPTEIVVRLLDEPANAPLLRVRRVEARASVFGTECTRLMFPLLPAFSMTIHRVQGATMEGDVHILLNAEVFADGMAYVAISRVRRLSQLHLWCLHREAIKANPIIDAEYERLARMRLDVDAVAAAPHRQRVRHLLPLA